MMTLQFHAVNVEANFDDYGILNVFLGNPEHYLMFQYEESEDEQDVELGMNTYHLERDEQSYGGYGGVDAAAL